MGESQGWLLTGDGGRTTITSADSAGRARLL
jgi:hypothetical protein